MPVKEKSGKGNKRTKSENEEKEELKKTKISDVKTSGSSSSISTVNEKFDSSVQIKKLDPIEMKAEQMVKTSKIKLNSASGESSPLLSPSASREKTGSLIKLLERKSSLSKQPVAIIKSKSKSSKKVSLKTPKFIMLVKSLLKMKTLNGFHKKRSSKSSSKFKTPSTLSIYKSALDQIKTDPIEKNNKKKSDESNTTVPETSTTTTTTQFKERRIIGRVLKNQPPDDQMERTISKSKEQTKISEKLKKEQKIRQAAELKEEIDLLMKKFFEKDDDDLEILEKILKHIDDAGGCFSSIPDIVKVLLPYYKRLKESYQTKTDESIKKMLADIISYLAIGHPSDSDGEILKYFLLGSRKLIERFGIIYVRDLSKDIQNVFYKNTGTVDSGTLHDLIVKCVNFFLRQNSETEATDLLIETEKLELLDTIVIGDELRQKVCRYIINCSNFMPPPEDRNILYAAMNMYMKDQKIVDGLFVALKLRDLKMVSRLFDLARSDKSIQKQMALILARHNVPFDEDGLDNDLLELLTNGNLNSYFISVARMLEVLQPRTPSDIFAKLNKKKKGNKCFTTLDMQKSLLGSTMMNCFLNAGFSTDNLLLTDKGSQWICRHKEHARITATGSLGIICLWDLDGGLTKIDQFLYSKDDFIKSGALLAFGLVNCTVKSEFEPAFVLLKDYVISGSDILRIGATLGMAIGNVGSNHTGCVEHIVKLLGMLQNELKKIKEKEDKIKEKEIEMETGKTNRKRKKKPPKRTESIGKGKESFNEEDKNKEILEKLESQRSEKMHLLGLGAISIGLIGHSSVDMNSIKTLIGLISKDDKVKLQDSGTRNIIHAIGLLVLGQKEEVEPILKEIEQQIESSSIKKYAKICLQLCAYAGSSNMIKIQELMHYSIPLITEEITDEDEKEKEKDKDEILKDKKKDIKTRIFEILKKDDEKKITTDEEFIQMISIIGVAVVSMSHDSNQEMLFRTLVHYLRMGNSNLKCVTVLAIAIANLSNPKLNILELLSKYCHSFHVPIIINSIIALGFVCAGTNNFKVSKKLMELSEFFFNKPDCLLATRVAHGLLHLGKGLLSLCPEMECQLFRASSLASMLALVFQLFEPVEVFQNQHYLLFLLTGAIRPKTMVTLNPDLTTISIPVHVGQAVDTIGLAGNPKSVCGFQTFTTPVILNRGEKAEMTTDKYIALNRHMEGFVIVLDNPDYNPEPDDTTVTTSSTKASKEKIISSNLKLQKILLD